MGGAELARSLEVWTDLERLPCIGRLGGGTFGRVTLHRTAEGEPRAVKTFRTNCSRAMRHNELAVFNTMLEHPHHNVLQAIAVVFTSPGPMLSAFVLPHLDSSLRDWMHRRIFIFTPEEACVLATQIFVAAGHLHSVGFMHRDIKPDNFLVNISTRDAPVLKLCDFGWAKRVGKDAHVQSADEANTPGCTTWPCRAPEVYMKLPYGIAADTWSCGVIAWELVIGQSVHQIGRRCDYRRDMARMLADSCLAKLHSKGTQALAERTLVEMAWPPVVCAGCPQCAAGKAPAGNANPGWFRFLPQSPASGQSDGVQ